MGFLREARRAGSVPAINAIAMIKIMTAIMSGIVYTTKLKVGKLSRKPPSAWKVALARFPTSMEIAIPNTDPPKSEHDSLKTEADEYAQ